ncbi:preprotein translocase subunit SecY [Candidatus Falkowbacteria bacterium HGW-Falkowbacteria-1]|jgi:preprotein translocase subunit SecY|uniref:Protein translocase subunit SecY n=1 Tax=Candidatus Falkowbacteria bacterium HGW-Falkowbacteria-1 TaxID=2013768 RepID=A0A2N2E964_9BACT|nr:MAG: preprotein translocase subunit SecY [Candidatus Falkowbacteria bacterium HGW-Falkowbacteria-1]
MFDKIVKIWKIRDLRNNILFVLLMLAIFRLFAHIPVPGVNLAALRDIFSSNQFLGLLNVFSGGSMDNFSIVMMGIAPYITSSIIFQLLGMIVPKLEEMQKEESGRQTINTWTRLATVPLAFIQAYGMITLLRSSGVGVMDNVGFLDLFIIIITVTAGTVFLMWIGELISEKKIGNGISLLIFAGIIASLPTAVQRVVFSFDQSQLFVLLGFVFIALVTVVGIVIINEGQRNIPVQYARQIRGSRAFGGTSTHLPLRVNTAGVIPIIFAISVIVFPSMIAQFFVSSKFAILANISRWTISFLENQFFYGLVYFLLVVGFTYFYTEIVFKPDQIAEDLQKQGGFIPGIRPGRHTGEYLQGISRRILLTGSLFLGLIAILPLVMKYFTGMQSLAIGGTSMLIVVSVVIETVKQIEAQISMRDYDGV